MIKRTTALILTSLLVFLTACDNKSTDQAVLQTTQNSEKIVNVSWLREKLPADTLAYLRIPTLWQMFFESKADVLHQAQKSAVHKDQINQLKQGFIDTYSDLLPKDARLPFETLLKNMASPLEVAVINASDGSMIPNVLIGTTFKNTSTQEIASWFELMVQLSQSQVKILKPFDTQGHAKLLLAMSPVFVYFDEKTGRLSLFSGLTTSQKQLTTMLDQSEHAAALNNIFDFENSVDQAGKNIEAWLNIKAIYQQNQGFIPANDKDLIKKLGLDKVDYVWLGTASAQGKSELVFRLSMPDSGFRLFMPRVEGEMNPITAGVPRSVWQIAIPDSEQIKQGFNLANSFNPKPQELEKIVTDKVEQIESFLDVSLQEILDTYGQKLVVVTDDSGTWFASKILNHSKHEEILDKLSKAFKSHSRTRQLAGVDIIHSIYNSKDFEKVIYSEEFLQAAENPITAKLNFNQSAYYQIEGDYFIQAFTPQVLADRKNSEHKLSLQDWLTKQQAHNWNNAILAHSQEVKDAPRDIYHTYLNILAILGYFSNVEVDLFNMPTAQQLQLPKTGRYGFSMDSSSDALTFKFSYEYSMFENFTFLDSYGFMTVGVLMAYAIPAYRDYTLRSKVAKELYAIDAEKILIAEHYAIHNSYPNTEFISDKFNGSKKYLYNPKNGEITVYFSAEDDLSLTGKSLRFTPLATDGYIHWRCTSSIAQSQLPVGCSKE